MPQLQIWSNEIATKMLSIPSMLGGEIGPTWSKYMCSNGLLPVDVICVGIRVYLVILAFSQIGHSETCFLMSALMVGQ